jgi:hypothetical protein
METVGTIITITAMLAMGSVLIWFAKKVEKA